MEAKSLSFFPYKEFGLNPEDIVEYIPICGIGSLMNPNSVKLTCEYFQHFRKVAIRGYVRAFNLVGISSIKSGMANVETGEICSLSCVKTNNPEDVIYCIIVDIHAKSWEKFVEREHRYKFQVVDCFLLPNQESKQNETILSEQFDNLSKMKALCCCQYSDELYFQERCCCDQLLLSQQVKQHWEYPVWYTCTKLSYEFCDCQCGDSSSNCFLPNHLQKSNVKPIRRYLQYCTQAAMELGDAYWKNFLEKTFLADETTTVGKYLEEHSEIKTQVYSKEPIKFEKKQEHHYK